MIRYYMIRHESVLHFAVNEECFMTYLLVCMHFDIIFIVTMKFSICYILHDGLLFILLFPFKAW